MSFEQININFDATPEERPQQEALEELEARAERKLVEARRAISQIESRKDLSDLHAVDLEGLALSKYSKGYRLPEDQEGHKPERFFIVHFNDNGQAIRAEVVRAKPQAYEQVQQRAPRKWYS